MRRLIRFCSILTVLFAHLATAPSLRAVTTSWTGGGGDNFWSTAANWNNGIPTNVAPPNATADVFFNGTPPRLMPDIDMDWSILSVTFNAGTAAITNHSTGNHLLTIGSGGITNNSSNVQTFTNNISIGDIQTWNAASGDLVFSGNTITDNVTLHIDGAHNTTVSGTFTGNGGLVKDGTGTLLMSGNASGFTGSVTINAGTMQAGSVNGLPSNVSYSLSGGVLDLNTHNLTVSGLGGGGEVKLTGANLTVNAASASSYAGVISGSGMLIKNGGGTFSISGANTYTGGTTINAGTLDATAEALPGDVVNNATLAFDNNTATPATYASVVSGTGNVRKVMGGAVILTGANTYTGTTTITGGTLQLGDGGTTGTIASTMDVSLTVSAATLAFDHMDDIAFHNKITGMGQVQQKGSGTLTLTGNNTYTGGTIINPGGTLEIADGGANPIGTGDVTDGGTLAVNRSTAFTLANNITNSGGLHQTGAGILTLIGANTYTGNTVIDAGTTLQVGDAGTAGTLGTGAVTDNGTLIVNRMDSVTISGNISGTGVLNQEGTGTTTLSGTNSYSGGTNIDAGTLQGTTNSLQGTIHNNSVLTFDQSFDGTYSGAVDGTGSVNKNGTGAVTFSGASTYTGPTNVNAGELTVNGSVTSAVTVSSGATLSGTGTTGSITNQGTVAPGSPTTPVGNLKVTGDFTNESGATTQIEINPTTGSQINLTGTATINGGTVHVVAESGNYNAGTKYTFLTATSRTGTYNNATAEGFPTFLLPVLGYTSDTAFFTLLRNGMTYQAVGRNFNQRAVGGYLDQISPTATGDLQTVFNGLNSIDDAELRVAMSQMSGAIHGTLGQLGVQNTGNLIGQIGNRLRASAFYPGCCQDNCDCAVAPRPGNADGSAIFLASYMGDCDDCCAPAAAPGHCCCCCCCNCWTGWGQGFAMGGSAKSDGNAEGIHYSSGGAVAGIERWLDCNHLMGFYGGYAGTDVNTNGPNQSVNGGNFGGYLYNDDGFNYWTLLGGFEFDGYATHRLLSFDDIQREANANYNGWQGYAYAERGFSFRSSTELIQPFVALQYIYLRQNPFTEQGAGSIDLATTGMNTNSLRSLLGMRLQDAWLHRTGRRSFPEVHAYWLHEYLDSDTSIDARFTGTTAGSGFITHGLDLGRDWVVAGTNFTWEMPGCWSVAVNYDLQTNTIQTFHLGSVSIGHVW
jgi:fibronectin-binding autotransporter adhesin